MVLLDISPHKGLFANKTFMHMLFRVGGVGSNHLHRGAIWYIWLLCTNYLY